MYRIGSIENGYFEAKPGHKWSWETPPAPIAASEIKETVEADVVIAGAGISGLARGYIATTKIMTGNTNGII